MPKSCQPIEQQTYPHCTMMNTMGIVTEAKLLDVEAIPVHNLLESHSVTTFMPEEEASICPLLSSNTNGVITPLAFSHPLTICNNHELDESNSSSNLCRLGGNKTDSCSSSGSSSSLAMNVSEDVSANLFNKHNSYKHLQPNNTFIMEESNGHNPHNGVLSMCGDTPSFVAWNWPLIRKCTFFAFLSGLLAMCAAVVALIASLPKTCNPKTAWYHGGVFYEIFPASFQDTNADGIGDLRGISKRLDYLSQLDVSGIRLNSIFSSTHYPEDYYNVTTLLSIAPVLGNERDLQQLIMELHERNISLMLDLPVQPFLSELSAFDAAETMMDNNWTTISNQVDLKSIKSPFKLYKNSISEALQYWVKFNVDGFYIKGLNYMTDNDLLPYYLREWKNIIGSNRVLMVSEDILNAIVKKKSYIWNSVDLVDVYIETVNHSMKSIENRIQGVLSSEIGPSGSVGVWIQWTVGGENHHQRLTSSYNHQKKNVNGQYSLAITLLQLMLPGTPSIFYGDEIGIQAASDPYREHYNNRHLQQLSAMRWITSAQEANSSYNNVYLRSEKILPWMPTSNMVHFENLPIIINMIMLRDRSPPIYKNAICKQDAVLPNTALRKLHGLNMEDILIIERVYPRRNTFVAISNLGEQSVSLDLNAMYYSGEVQLDQSKPKKKIYFNEFKIGARQTIIVKLDK